MNRHCLIRQAVRYAIAVAASSTALPVLAQEASTPTPAMEEVTVVGTRIVRKDYEATSPVVTVSEDTFKLSGEPQIETVLNTLPQLVPSITTTSNNPSNGGQANVDLRGLGTVRTLVLVDGARVTPSNVNGVVDLNTIPAALIESVEILTGGSSATYGSDAIAGVVNIKLKRNFNGIEIRAQQGVTGEGDGKSTVFDGIMGGNFADDRGNAVVVVLLRQAATQCSPASASSASMRRAHCSRLRARARSLKAASTGAPMARARRHSTRCSAAMASLLAQSTDRVHRLQCRRLAVLAGWRRPPGAELRWQHGRSGLQPERAIPTTSGRSTTCSCRSRASRSPVPRATTWSRKSPRCTRG